MGPLCRASAHHDMNKRSLTVILFALLFLAVLGWLVWHGSSQSDELASHSHIPVPNTNGLSRSNNFAQDGMPDTVQSLIAAARRQVQSRERADRGKDEWRTPIDFYGLVIDESNLPVQGAQIEFGWTDLSSEGYSRDKATSDRTGRFALEHRRGKHLTVNVRKEGYYFSARDNSNFTYAGENVNFVANSNSPIVFHLRKKGTQELLAVKSIPGFAKIAKLPRTGSAVEIDLLKGTIVSNGGHLVLEFNAASPTNTIRQYDWRCRLSVPKGGLLQTDEEFMFQAPEKGYQSAVSIEMAASDPDWSPEARKRFFVLLPNGQFGRFDFHLLARNGVFSVDSFVNLSGSRNLEFDPDRVGR